MFLLRKLISISLDSKKKKKKKKKTGITSGIKKLIYIKKTVEEIYQ